MHRTENVLESRMFGCWENPPSGLELVDVTHSLDPGMVNHLALGSLPLVKGFARREWNITVDGVVA
ncbi:MAG: hypothetical protein QGG09_14970 [Pirellulaceae bacterium]|nr:hypothetical protein [Pirellulaceae bacterium]